jgi:hypothetical protein
MPPRPDPLKVYFHAIAAGDHPLAGALAARLFPWRRRPADPDRAPAEAALATILRLARVLHLAR